MLRLNKVNFKLQDILDKHTAPWGIKVSLVGTKQVDLGYRDAAGHRPSG